jgi:hypothetical protein
MVWFTKKPAHRELNPPVASTQEHNNTEPGESIAQSDVIQTPAEPPKKHKMHEHRSDALEALGLHDLAPPPGNAIITNPGTPHGRPPKAPQLPQATPEHDALQKRINDVAQDEAVTKERIKADIRLSQFTASLNQSSEINAALAPQRSYDGKCDQLNEDEVIRMLERGYLQIEIARHFNIAPVTLLDWIKSTPERFARSLTARESAGQACDAKAMEVLSLCTPETAYKARAIASYLQWRARMFSPEYQDKQRLTVDGGLTIQHETPDRPAITDLIGQALAVVTPAPRMTDVE